MVARHASERRGSRGFTLIEMVIALAIITVLFAAVVYGVGALTGARAKESSAEIAGVIRSLYDTAALSGRTCRLVFELPQERADDSVGVSYHAECAKAGATVSAKRDEELREVNAADKKKKNKLDDNDTRFHSLNAANAPTTQELMAREKTRVEEAAKFSAFSNEEVVDRKLPSTVSVEVWTQKQHDPVRHGAAYLYFFPQGFTERAQVYVKQGTNVWTLTIAPLTGKTVIFPEQLEVPHS